MWLVYIDLGRASLVAKQHVTIAEIWESEPDQIEKSIDHYRKASQVYRGEEQQSQVCPIFVNVELTRQFRFTKGKQMRSQSGVNAGIE